MNVVEISGQDPTLFAVLEAPQASVRFSPFEPWVNEPLDQLALMFYVSKRY